MDLLSKVSASRFTRRKLDINNDQSNANCSIGNKVIYNNEALKSNLCDYNNAYILVRGDIIIIGQNVSSTLVALKYCAPFIKYITKIDVTTIDDT